MNAAKLTYHPLRRGGKEEKAIRRLYRASFPDDERAPFSMLLRNQEHGKFEIYEDEEGLVGFVYLVEEGKLVYLFYFALEEAKRNQGYGSAILALLSKRYQGRSFFLMAEDPDVGEDQELRKRRIGFYQRNGFTLTKTKVNEWGVDYVLLCQGETVDGPTFVDFMSVYLGEEAFHRYYEKHVKTS